MGITINPLEIINILDSRRRRKNENAQQFIERIAIEADDLANIWEEIVKSLIAGNEIDRQSLRKLGASRWIPENSIPYTRIEHFYQSISKSLGNNNSQHLIDVVTNHVARILVGRREVNSSLNELLEHVDSDVFFSDLNQELAIKDLAEIARVLRNESAALYVLSKQIEANID
ncbi:hypothetical protein ACX07_06915 [Vibrio parahaemolyticus]|uniref:hypothetical protein n=1 Tax=Vibrio parahaemolyticus TaxID=670 RepID=UPI0006A74A49|nr:hypothetical protein [Vibrio parahaemolyticus]KOF50400.1 hypothetical protein ACX07_06915 [Vibrio parahaemolyticus]MCS0004923.1 hypothetical protein [Vibrio parahaemolyticus]